MLTFKWGHMTIPKLITLTKDILIGLAAIITAIVAAIGLKNWRRELKGKAEFEIARGLMRTTYKLRDELQNCRSPFISFNEYPEGYKGPLSGSSPEEDAKALEYVYKNRWKPVRDVLHEFETFALEAEALWGKEVRSQTNEFLQCVRKLSNAIFAVIQDFKGNKDFAKKMKSIVYGFGDENDELWLQINKNVNNIENEVRPHLKQKS
jgi:hypothetical protein